jgi:protein TonB
VTTIKTNTIKKVSIAAGVANGLLIKKTSPDYPAIAQAARVSGTVIHQVTISENGIIEGIQIISGPAMLQQAAIDAVRNWRYKPYLLDDEPVKVDTTVNVVFALPH